MSLSDEADALVTRGEYSVKSGEMNYDAVEIGTSSVEGNQYGVFGVNSREISLTYETITLNESYHCSSLKSFYVNDMKCENSYWMETIKHKVMMEKLGRKGLKGGLPKNIPFRKRSADIIIPQIERL